jgi:hypothetical protein
VLSINGAVGEADAVDCEAGRFDRSAKFKNRHYASSLARRRLEDAMRKSAFVREVGRESRGDRRKSLGRTGRRGIDGMGWIRGLFWKGGGKQSGLPDTRRRPC